MNALSAFEQFDLQKAYASALARIVELEANLREQHQNQLDLMEQLQEAAPSQGEPK